jgi:hypothetical protein
MAVELPMKVAAILTPFIDGKITFELNYLLVEYRKPPFSHYSESIQQNMRNSYFGHSTFVHPLPSWTFGHGKWQPPSNIGHGEDRKLPSYSFVKLILIQNGIGENFGIEHLLSQFGHSQCPILLTSTGSQRGKSGHKKVKTREWDHTEMKGNGIMRIGIGPTLWPICANQHSIGLGNGGKL